MGAQQGRRPGFALKSERGRELALAAERTYQRLVSDWQATGAAWRRGAGAAAGRASGEPAQAQAARQTKSPVAPAL